MTTRRTVIILFVTILLGGGLFLCKPQTSTTEDVLRTNADAMRGCLFAMVDICRKEKIISPAGDKVGVLDAAFKQGLIPRGVWKFVDGRYLHVDRYYEVYHLTDSQEWIGVAWTTSQDSQAVALVGNVFYQSGNIAYEAFDPAQVKTWRLISSVTD